MTRSILALLTALAFLTITPSAEAKNGNGPKWKGPPPRGNAWGYYKSAWNPGWPGYWYNGYPSYYAPPPPYFDRPAPIYSFPPTYALPAPPLPEPLPPPLPPTY